MAIKDGTFVGTLDVRRAFEVMGRLTMQQLTGGTVEARLVGLHRKEDERNREGGQDAPRQSAGA